MRHRVMGRKLGRKTNHRIAMRRNMAVSLLTHGQITTTVPKAKAVKPFVERLITVARQGDLAARRRITRMLGQDHLVVRSEDDEQVSRNAYGEIATKGGKKQAPRVVKLLVDQIAPRYADRTGGYTRIIKLAKHRIGDGADLCVLQLVGDEEGPQVSGQFSRRREKANRRMERAAALRRGTRAAEADPEQANAVVEAEPDQAAAVAEAEPDSTPVQPQTPEDGEQKPAS